MYDAAGDREAFEKAALVVKDKQRKLRAFVTSNPSLVRDYSRESVATYKNNIINELSGNGKEDIIKVP